MSKKLADGATALLKRAADTLFVLNPRGTSIGALSGVVVDGILRAFTPAVSRIRDILDTSGLSVYHLVCAGIVAFNIPALFRRRALPKDIEDAFEVIDRSKATLSPLQVKSAYLRLCGEVVERVERRQAGSPPTAKA